MSNFIQSRDILIDFLKSEMHGPTNLETLGIDKEKINIINYEDELEFNTFKEASRLSRQENGQEVLTLIKPQGDEQPTRRYGVGVLFPYEIKNEEEEAEENNLEFFSNPDDEPENNAIEKKTKDKINNQILKKQRIKPKNDFSEGVADIKSSNELKQSSMGISFFAKIDNNSKLKLFNKEGSECGIYLKRIVNIKENTGGDHFAWFRIPISLDFEFDSNTILNSNGLVNSNNGLFENGNIKLECKLLVRKIDNTKDNVRLITAYLVNRSDNKSSKDEKCLFQSNFSCSFFDNSNKKIDCILPYPEASLNSDNNINEDFKEEDQSLDLVFRNKQTFAIGHGCSADWNQEKGKEIIDEISSTHFPIYDSANVTSEIIHNNIPFEIEMAELAGLKNASNDEIFDKLTQLSDLYSRWISKQQEQSILLEEKYKEAASNNIDKCKETLNRIISGIDFLRNDDLALKAFKLANHAILSQQVRTKRYKDDERDWEEKIDGKILPKIEYTEPDIIENIKGIGKWRPFQLAFILSSLESTAKEDHVDRNIVELIFFPTGGGKTEAYLGMISFLSFYKRLNNSEHQGVDVIMRYTLRLLTTQQFSRAASLICSMEKIRQENIDILGKKEFSIGVWLGQASTPNRKEKAKNILRDLNNSEKDDNIDDPFLLTKCPWCSAGIGQIEIKKKSKTNKTYTKFDIRGIHPSINTVKFMCDDDKCHFSLSNGRHLPIYVIDDDIYEKKPTVLIATVDKFAQVAWMPEARSIFGFDMNGKRVNDPPSLILQDELHLITGPLGSMFGIYETLIEELCSYEKNNTKIKPKIICSTATIKRYKNQIKNLFNRDNATLFPPLGIDIEDNFFGKYKYKDDNQTQLDNPKKFIGIHGTGLGSTQTAQVRVYSALLQSVMFMHEDDRDPWFTLMNFFGSIRELATTLTLLETDIPNRIMVLLERFGLTIDEIRKIGKKGNQTLELTSRLKNKEVPKAIGMLEKSSNIAGCVDVCLASNIIEVGVDIDRLSLLTIFGQPKSTSSYIQVSGRIGRKWQERPGVVVTIYGPMRPRDKSHFEKFKSFHQRLYAQVEPSSVTPFAKPVLERTVHALMVGYVRMQSNKDFQMQPTKQNGEIPNDLLSNIYNTIKERIIEISKDKDEIINFEKIFRDKKIEWDEWKRSVYSIKGDNSTNPLIHSSGSYVPPGIRDISWPTPTSLRNVDAECMTYVTDQYIKDKAEDKKKVEDTKT